MPTYDAEVLADSPLFYPKLEDLSGSVMTDTSGNADHGDLNTTVSPVAQLGLAGPIETDALSLAAGQRIGRKLAASGSSLDLRTSQTWEVWGKPDGSLTPRTLLAREGIPTSNGSNVLYFNGTTVIAKMAHASGENWSLSYGPLAVDAWHHIVVTRNGNVMRLYVNGILRDERTDLPSGSIVYAAYNASEWSVGYSSKGAAIGFYSTAVSHLALYASQLSAGRVLAHYEAAKAVLPLSATIFVRFGVELDTDQADPIDFPFTHNFANAISGQPNPLTEIISYKTNILQSEPDYQQRVNAQPHHTQRFLEYWVTAVGQQRSRLQACLWTPGETYKLPIARDWGKLTAAANSSDVTLSLDTTLREYEVGSYVAVWANIFDASTAQFFRITSVSDTELGITPAVTTEIPNNSVVMPARLACLPDDELRVESHMVDRETAVLQFEVLSTEVGDRRVTPYTPTETYLSEEVFTLERAKVEWLDQGSSQIRRRMEQPGTHTGNDYQRPIDTGSPGSIPMRVTLNSREAQSEFYGWLDARQGSQNPVWLRSEDNDVQVTARAGSSITITYIGYTNRYRVHGARRDLAFLKPDGTWVYKRITDAVDNGDGTETLSVSSPPLLADIKKVSFLKRCTAPDRFEITYHRSGTEFIAECEFSMVELLTTPEP